MLVLVYHKCSTCQKALKWLDEHKIFFEERPIIEENPTYEELKEWYEKSGMPLKKFFNTSGMLYKQMNLKDKLPEMSEDEQLKLLATDGMLVKRPLVVGEDFVLTGFREKRVGREDSGLDDNLYCENFCLRKVFVDLSSIYLLYFRVYSCKNRIQI